MGQRNYLIEGVSGSGKTTVCDELLRRGQQAVHGDRVLAYQGDPLTGIVVDGHSHRNHLWRVETVRSMVADRTEPMTFFCGGSRNSADFIDLFDGVFVLEVDVDTLMERLERRPVDEFGGQAEERELVRRLHQSGEDTPPGFVIDATAPLTALVDEILRLTSATIATRDPRRADEFRAGGRSVDP